MTHFNMTEREWLSKQDPPLAKFPARGRLSREAHVALEAARAEGHTWQTVEKPEPKRAVKQVDRSKVPTVVNGKTTPMIEKVSEPEVDPGAIREWAQSNGVEVSARGRISASVREAYMSAVAPEDRALKVEQENDFGPTPPMVNPAGTTYEGFYHGKTIKTTAGNGAGVCMKIGYSVGWCDAGSKHPGKPHTILTEYSSDPIDVVAIRR